SYAWNFGDGGLNAPGQVLQKAYGDNAVTPFTVTLSVTDDENAMSSQPFSVTVNNAIPVLTAVGSQTADEGESLMLTDIAMFSDAGLESGGVFNFAINWGDGSGLDSGMATIDQAGAISIPGPPPVLTPTLGSFDGTHVYAEDGTYTVMLTVTDKDSGVGTAQFDVVVANVAPTVTPAGSQSVNEGATLNLTDIATFIDPEFAGSPGFSYSINWGDGTAVDTGTANVDQAGSAGVPTGGSFDGTHVYADDGVYTVTLSVTDEADDPMKVGETGTGTFQVTVGNVAPSLSPVTPPATLIAGQLLEFTGSFGDVAADADSVDVSLDFGDGVQSRALLSGGTFMLPHVFPTSGTPTVTVTATDKDSGQTQQQFMLTVVAPDIIVQSAVLNGTTATITYEIVEMSPASLELGVFQSIDTDYSAPDADASTPEDSLLDTITLTAPADLTIGTHMLTVNLGAAAADLSLPGSGLPGTDEDHYLLVVADPDDLILEDDADPFDEDNTAVMTGTHHLPGGELVVHTDSGADVISFSGNMLTVNGAMQTIDPMDAPVVRVLTHGGADQFTVSNPSAAAFFAAGDGGDQFTLDFTSGLTGALTLSGGTAPGNDQLILQNGTFTDVSY
ncbi:MAG: PKD domain-containing protein, partial [Planctomycetaceae bacterium]